MDRLNSLPTTDIRILEKMIENALSKSAAILGPDAFRLINDGRRGPINMNVFESIMFIMVELDAIGINHIDINKVKSKVIDWIHTEKFRDNIGNRRDSATKLQWRINESIKMGRKLAGND